MAIDQEEGKLLASASANVLEQFDLKPDPKVQAIVGLVVACGTVYGPRAYLIRNKLAQRAKEKQPGTAGVYTAEGEAAGTTEFSRVN